MATTKHIPRIALSFILACLPAIGGCAREGVDEPARSPLKVSELPIRIDSTERSYFLSDRRGGFLTGEVRPRSAEGRNSWSVEGTPVLEIVPCGSGGGRPVVDSAVLFPNRIVISSSDGTVLQIEPVELPSAGAWGVALTLRGPGAAVPAEGLMPARDFRATSRHEEGISVWTRQGSGNRLSLVAGEGMEIAEGGIRVRGGGEGSALCIFSDREIPPDSFRVWCGRLPQFADAREARMERLLNRAYLRLNDSSMTKAIAWMRLSLDALVREGRDTLAVAGLPWDGSFDGRQIAQSIAGIGLATGEYSSGASILRALAGRQDTVSRHATYGRIPSRIRKASMDFRAVDAAPWFVREMYEHVTLANDTALAREMYPVVARSIRGVLRHNTNQNNLLVHAPDEVMMGGQRFARGALARAAAGERFAAVEVQLLWYFQQLIGSYIADYVGDRESAQRWEQGAKTTTARFDSCFVDTTRKLVYDHLDGRGKGVLVHRPNAFCALEVLGDEAVQQNMLRELMASLLHPHGVGSLSSTEAGFTPFAAGTAGGPAVNGPVWTSLLGQATYALSRYDRQDMSFRPAHFLLTRALEEDVVGAIPEQYDVRPRPGEQRIRSAGSVVSLTGMAELIRSFYQDYFGVHVDAPSKLLRTEPKLPLELSSVEFTIAVGMSPVDVSYQRGKDSDRITIAVAELPEPLKWSFIWTMANGDAWRGSLLLDSGDRVSVVLTSQDVVAFRGTAEVSLEDRWRIAGFSRREEISGLGFADPGH